MRKPFLILAAMAALFSCPAHAEDAPLPPGKAVSWVTPDGLKIAGRYHAAASGHRVWVLLHGLGSNRGEWHGFAGKLVEQGDGYLIYDARGHGDSIHTTDGKTVGYVGFKTIGEGSQWAMMIGDLGNAVQFLETQQAVKEKQIAVGGASLGANVALAYAAQHPEVPALILLSPGLQYAGITSEEAFRRYAAPRPVFIAASAGDTYAYQSAQQLTAIREDKACKIVQGPGAAHGVNMFNPAFTKALLDWITALKS